MAFLTNIQNLLLDTALPFIVLLGLLIFVHELGHFLVAKMCKVRVETFSLGFGKKIITYVKGHTTYCISLIPLGGYVKMFGDDPTAEVSEEDRKESFSHKPVGQRIAIVLAGPLMNFFFAILLFTIVMTNGDKTLNSEIGDIKEGSYAQSIGFQPGDKVISINNNNTTTWNQITDIIKANAEAPLNFNILRKGNNTTLSATPELIKNTNPLEWDENVGDIKGLSPLSRTSHIAINTSAINSASQAGLKTLDKITHVNNVPIKFWRELEKELISSINNKTIALTIEREPAQNTKTSNDSKNTAENQASLKPITKNITLNIDSTNLTPSTFIKDLGIESPELYISQTVKDMPAEIAGIKKGDRIISINNTTLTSWDDVITQVNSYNPDDSSPIKFDILRESKLIELNITPKIQEITGQQGQITKRFQVGIAPAIFLATTEPIILKLSPLSAIKYGWNQTLKWSGMISLSLIRMIQNKISPKNIGGIISIGQVASQTYKQGLSSYLKMMAAISINLFILNLLPIPILDGGHLVFFIIEALRGSPVSIKKLALAQQVGLILLVSLMVFSLFNDISRIW